MKRLSLLFAFILTSLFSFAQKGVEFVDGWIELKKGDTLKGKVCYINTVTKERYEKIYFLDAAGAKKRYGFDRITSFGVEGKVYEYLIVDGFGTTPIMMQRVIAGDLYMFKAWFKAPDFTPQKPNYEEAVFLRKKDSSEYFEVYPKNFYKQMKSYFRGDEDIVELVKENNYELKDLEKIVVAYNEKE